MIVYVYLLEKAIHEVARAASCQSFVNTFLDFFFLHFKKFHMED